MERRAAGVDQNHEMGSGCVTGLEAVEVDLTGGPPPQPSTTQQPGITAVTGYTSLSVPELIFELAAHLAGPGGGEPMVPATTTFTSFPGKWRGTLS